jgi:IclR family acetate operon transcriptional repressor
VEKKGKTKRYSIGPTLYTLGSLYLSTTDIFRASEPVIKMLNDLTGEVIGISILDDKGHMTIVMKEESKHTLRLGFPAGFSSPSYANASGKALLSDLTDAEIDSFYPEENLKPLTKKTIRTKTELKKELEQVRKTGVAFHNEESFQGVEAVAALIRDDKGKGIAAVAIGVPKVRITKVKRKKLATLIKLAASIISHRLGYHELKNPVTINNKAGSARGNKGYIIYVIWLVLAPLPCATLCVIGQVASR